MRSFLTTTILAIGVTSPVWADTAADIDYIVSQTVTRPLFEAAIQAQRPINIGAIANELRPKGLEVSDLDAFFDLFMGEFIDIFTASMQAQTGALYKDLMTPEQIQGLAAFYRTDAGQALINVTPRMMIEGAALGRLAGTAAGQQAGTAILERMKREGITIGSPSLTQRLLDALQ